MPQLSLYLDETTMEILRRESNSEQISMSRYAANLIQKHTAVSAWPKGYWDNVYGCLNDGDFEEPEELDLSLDDSCDWFE